MDKNYTKATEAYYMGRLEVATWKSNSELNRMYEIEVRRGSNNYEYRIARTIYDMYRKEVSEICDRIEEIRDVIYK